MAYKKSFKLHVIKTVNNRRNNTVSDMAMIHNVSERSIYYWKNNKHLDNQIIKRKSKITVQILCYMQSYILRNKYLSTIKLTSLIKKKFNVTISESYLYDIIHDKLNMSYRRAKPKQYRFNNILHNRKVKELKNTIKSININDLYSLDEIHFSSKMEPIYRWQQKNIDITTSKNNKNITHSTIAAIRINKSIFKKTFNRSINGEIFLDYLKELHKTVNLSGKYILLDNARIHHYKKINEFLKLHNITLIYNVPYNPKTNPIEHIFSKVKHCYRKLKKNKNNIKVINKAFKSINNTDIINCYTYSFN